MKHLKLFALAFILLPVVAVFAACGSLDVVGKTFAFDRVELTWAAGTTQDDKDAVYAEMAEVLGKPITSDAQFNEEYGRYMTEMQGSDNTITFKEDGTVDVGGYYIVDGTDVKMFYTANPNEDANAEPNQILSTKGGVLHFAETDQKATVTTYYKVV